MNEIDNDAYVSTVLWTNGDSAWVIDLNPRLCMLFIVMMMLLYCCCMLIA